MSRCLSRVDLVGQPGSAAEIRLLNSEQAMATFALVPSWRWQDGVFRVHEVDVDVEGANLPDAC